MAQPTVPVPAPTVPVPSNNRSHVTSSHHQSSNGFNSRVGNFGTVPSSGNGGLNLCHVINAQQFVAPNVMNTSPASANVFITNNNLTPSSNGVNMGLYNGFGGYPAVASNTYHSANSSVIHLTNGGIANSSSSSSSFSSCGSGGMNGFGALVNLNQPLCSLYQIAMPSAQTQVVGQKASAQAAKRCFSFDDIEDDGFLP